MLSLILAVLAPEEPPYIGGQRGRPPEPWRQTMEAVCGPHTLSITNFGAARPMAVTASVLVDGLPVVGERADTVRRDLSSKTAAYRIEVLCGGAGEFLIRINQGEVDSRSGLITYRVASGTLRGRSVLEYSGFETSDAETFWFR